MRPVLLLTILLLWQAAQAQEKEDFVLKLDHKIKGDIAITFNRLDSIQPSLTSLSGTDNQYGERVKCSDRRIDVRD